MKKTTVYIPEPLKASLEHIAASEGRSEADLIREALSSMVDARKRPRPRVPLTGAGLGDPTAAERVDELLAGFGSE